VELLAQFVTNILAFLLLLAILKRFAWGPLLTVIDERRAKIADEFAGIERTKAEMARLKTQYERELTRIEESARRKLAEAVNEGRRVAAEMEEEARAHAQASLVKAKEALQLEVAKAKIELRNQIVGLTLEATEKLLRTRMDATKDRALVEAFLAELDGGNGTRAAAPVPGRA